MKPSTRLAALLLVPVLASFAWLADARPQEEAPVPPVTVFVTRHAETAADTNSSRDPELSEAGQERATALARLLSKAGVTHVYSSGLRRTTATVRPLAEAMGLEVQVVAPDRQADQVTALEGLAPGSVAVVAGHSNTVPGIVAALGGEVLDLEEHPRYGGMLRHGEYDRLFVVTLPAGPEQAPRAIELRYGD